MGLGERGRRGNWRNQWGMATTRYGGPITVRPMVEEDTSQALIEGLINENISSKSFDLLNGIRIFIMVSKSFMPKRIALKSFTQKTKKWLVSKQSTYTMSLLLFLSCCSFEKHQQRCTKRTGTVFPGRAFKAEQGFKY